MGIDYKLRSQINGRKGGRPKQDSKIHIELPGISLVILTPSQYELLIKKYNVVLVSKAISILDRWLRSGKKQAKKYIGKNNYAHFRVDGWVINTAIAEIKQQT